MAATPHRRIDGDPAALIVHDGNCRGDDARHDAGGEHNRARVDDLVADADTAGLDRLDGRRDADIGAAPLKHARRHGRQFLVDFRQNACAGLEQQEPNLVASEPRIEAQHVIGECRQLAQQLDTDQAAADHDDGEAAATGRRLRRGVGSLELFDQVISKHQRVRHRLERESVRRAGDQLLVRGRAERDDEMVVRQLVVAPSAATA